MKVQRQFLFLLSTPILWGLATQSARSFSITPTQPGASESYRYEHTYNAPEGRYYTVLNQWSIFNILRRLGETGRVSEIEPGGSLFFLNVLNSEFGNRYHFIDKGSLQGSFNINVYRACAPQFECDIRSDKTTILPASGAAFELQYDPLEDSSDPVGSSVHWIQRAIRNYDVDFTSGAIINDQIHADRIDVRPGASSPYYEESFPGSDSNSTIFRDIPHVDLEHSRRNHYFYAELYLANELLEAYIDPFTGVSKKQVEIYSGVRWGWENTFFPKDEDDNYCPVATGNCTSDNPPSDPPGGLCFNSTEQRDEPCGSGPSAARFTSPDADVPSELTSVPEPTTTAAVLAVGVWAGISWRKRKGEKELSTGNNT